MTALSPDNFLVGLHTTFSDALIDSASRARRNLRKTVPSVEDFLALERQGLAAFAAILRRNAARFI